jgi:hypothetical protein
MRLRVLVLSRLLLPANLFARRQRRPGSDSDGSISDDCRGSASPLVATAAPPFPLQVNVFFGSILTGSLFQQLRSFLAEPTKLPETLGNAIPSKSSFFITYIMVDGWAGFPAELLRLWPLLLYHIRVAFFVVTDRDRDNAMNVQRLQYEQLVRQTGRAPREACIVLIR